MFSAAMPLGPAWGTPSRSARWRSATVSSHHLLHCKWILFRQHPRHHRNPNWSLREKHLRGLIYRRTDPTNTLLRGASRKINAFLADDGRELIIISQSRYEPGSETDAAVPSLPFLAVRITMGQYNCAEVPRPHPLEKWFSNIRGVFAQKL